MSTTEVRVPPPARAPGRGQLAVPGGERLWARVGWAVFALGIGLLAAFGATTGQLGTLRVATTVLMYVVLTEAWSVLGGFGGYLNFGMAMFFGVGAYTAAIVSNHAGIPPLATVVACGAVAGILAVVVGIPSLRLRGAYFAIVTFVLTLAIQQLVSVLGITNGALGLYLKPVSMSPRASLELYFFIFLGGAVAATLLTRQLARSRFGSALVAIREDEDAAEILGIPTTRVKTLAFVLAAVIAGMVGCVYASQLYYIEPTGTFDFAISLNVVVGAIVGGVQSWVGPLLGAGTTQLLSQELLTRTQGVEGNLVLGALLVLFARFVPGGIVGVVRRRGGTKVTV
ncbi:MAG TPA: branched-chain amino acid ABC transporter permease [Acidimicrobiales bacterium]|nr:branched-chain amino acid ABC transporter permease [Acidimicrobiales bacterium]